MFIASFITGPFQTNCYLLAREQGSECVIVDPGMGAEEFLGDALRTHHLVPVAIAVTHGHIDHIGSARQVGDEYGIPVLCPRDDRHLLSDPMAGLSDFARPLIEQWYGSTTLREPEQVVDVEPFSHHQFANLDLEFLHAPGHTAGCSMIRTIDAEFGPIVMSGDVVFAGSIGRTDMPGGDPAQMSHSLSDVVWSLDDSTYVLPGHGGPTTMANERLTNPFLGRR
ncbi:MBL fold metallo-hydrolase [Cutibacterium acnes]